VDEDARLIKIGQDKDLKILQAQTMDYLESQPLESLKAVFIQDMGERGDTSELLWMVTALADRMERDGKVVVLNHHPRSVLGVEEAFADPTLLRLVHHETMEGLFRQVGFREVMITIAGEFSPDEIKAWKEKMGGGQDLESGELAALLFAPRHYLLEARR
jgi:hypothetical protein